MTKNRDSFENHLKFTHDISSPLMVASGNIEALLSEKAKPNPSGDLERLKKVKTALDKITQLLKEHRAELKAMGEMDKSEP
ncbi:MAG: hypothetical protein KDD35_07575 [Bdellovibrionales bacterium]|nr:hypothetical protein [Bdellovibrionales bacterium]